MQERIIVGLVSAIAGGVLTYGASVLELRGRIEGVERSLARIEARLFPPQKEVAP